MSMNFTRYDTVRKRLIELYNLLNNKVYRVWIAPEKLMTLDQLRSRPTYHQEGFANDTNYYSEKQMRSYKLPRMIDLMENLESYRDLTFEKPTASIIELYEGIQEWISLWCDIMRNLPDMKHPVLSELRKIENFAYLIFPEYKRMKPYQNKQANSRAALEANLVHDKGLATLASLFGMNSTMGGGYKSESISWYSHLDALIPDNQQYADAFDPGALLRISDGFKSLGEDSLAHMDNGLNHNPNWIFNAG